MFDIFYILDWRLLCAVLSGILTIVSIFPYVRQTLLRRARPHFVTWFIWSTTSIIGATAQYESGASFSIAVVIANALATGVVALLALAYGVKKYTLIDTACLICAICTIIVWQLTNDAAIAIALAILIDTFAAIPTILKTYRHPRSETAWTYFVFAGAAFLGLLSSTLYDFANIAYPIYFVGIYFLIGILAVHHTHRATHKRLWQK